jgi:hypothetical protein
MGVGWGLPGAVMSVFLIWLTGKFSPDDFGRGACAQVAPPAAESLDNQQAPAVLRVGPGNCGAGIFR